MLSIITIYHIYIAIQGPKPNINQNVTDERTYGHNTTTNNNNTLLG